SLAHHPVTNAPPLSGWTGRLAAVNPPSVALAGARAACLLAVFRFAGGNGMNIQAHRAYGSQSMAAPLKRVLMRSAASAMRHAKPAEWHYGPRFDAARAASQHDAFADLVAASGAQVEWLTDADDGLADSVFTHDPSLSTDHGAVILSMGK